MGRFGPSSSGRHSRQAAAQTRSQPLPPLAETDPTSIPPDRETEVPSASDPRKANWKNQENPWGSLNLLAGLPNLLSIPAHAERHAADEEGAPAPRSRPASSRPTQKRSRCSRRRRGRRWRMARALRPLDPGRDPAAGRRSRAVPPARHAWEITGANVARIERVNAPLAQGLFGTRASFGLGNPAARQDQVLAGSAAVPTLVYRSLARSAPICRGRIDSRIRAVLYDPERWPSTPAAEQRDPIARCGSSRSWPRSRLQGRARPGPRPARGAGARCGAKGESLDQAYLRCGFAARPASPTSSRSSPRRTSST